MSMGEVLPASGLFRLDFGFYFTLHGCRAFHLRTIAGIVGEILVRSNIFFGDDILVSVAVVGGDSNSIISYLERFSVRVMNRYLRRLSLGLTRLASSSSLLLGRRSVPFIVSPATSVAVVAAIPVIIGLALLSADSSANFPTFEGTLSLSKARTGNLLVLVAQLLGYGLPVHLNLI